MGTNTSGPGSLATGRGRLCPLAEALVADWRVRLLGCCHRVHIIRRSSPVQARRSLRWLRRPAASGKIAAPGARRDNGPAPWSGIAWQRSGRCTDPWRCGGNTHKLLRRRETEPNAGANGKFRTQVGLLKRGSNFQNRAAALRTGWIQARPTSHSGWWATKRHRHPLEQVLLRSNHFPVTRICVKSRLFGGRS
jgi:hypothetical protein